MTGELHDEIRRLFHQAHSVLITSHVRPDGDAVGALLGLGLTLRAAGIPVQMTLADGVPPSFRHLPGADQIQRRPEGEFDLRVVLDCSDLLRAGDGLNGFKPDLNIDHHVTNLNFAAVNFVIPDAVATSAILAEYLPQWGLPIPEEAAQALLTGLVSDTLGFRTSNTTPHALRLAATLIETGANLSELYNRALVRRTFEAAHLWGVGLSHLQRENRIVWTELSLEDKAALGYNGNDDADLINMLASIDGSDAAIIFVEQRDGRVKVSWRTQPGFDVSLLALQFGGGGHPAAAGAMISGTLEEVKKNVLEATRTLINNRNSTIKNNGAEK